MKKMTNLMLANKKKEERNEMKSDTPDQKMFPKVQSSSW